MSLIESPVLCESFVFEFRIAGCQLIDNFERTTADFLSDFSNLQVGSSIIL
ncbi:MAG: hypothetical protein KF752_18550 [Pirellulaceae bacterium]|nr:hypothetical protein [Pirellulaceae bacterium]